MTRRKFLPPNFRCRIRRERFMDWWMMRADSREALKAILEAHEYEVLDIVEYNFEDWLERAKTATKQTLESGGSKDYKFQDDIWSDLKQYLFELFSGKCAYCEALVRHVAYGDVEHYRPKKALEEEGANHPGYYWLAYDVTNLLPSCQLCNQHRKRNRFPVDDGFWARRPEEVIQEQPLLLNPYRDDDPEEHLEFRPVKPEGPPISIVRGRTVKGEKSEEIYNLNRPGLPEARGEVVFEVEHKWMIARRLGREEQFWQSLHSGEAEYSLAQLVQLKWLVKQLEERLHIQKRVRADSN